MAKFYVIGKVSKDLLHRMQKDPTADRFASTKKVCDSIGVKLTSYEWVRGRFDIITHTGKQLNYYRSRNIWHNT